MDTAHTVSSMTTSQLRARADYSSAEKRRRIDEATARTIQFKHDMRVANYELDSATTRLETLQADRVVATKKDISLSNGCLDWSDTFFSHGWTRANHVKDTGPLNGVVTAFMLGLKFLADCGVTPPDFDPELWEAMLEETVKLYDGINRYNNGSRNHHYVGFYHHDEALSFPTNNVAGRVEITGANNVIRGFAIGNELEGSVSTTNPVTNMIAVIYRGRMSRHIRGQAFDYVPHGYGEYLHGGMTRYSGSYFKGTRCGEGRLFDPQGMLTYSGTWARNKPNGHGTMFSQTALWKEFTAVFKNSKPTDSHPATISYRNGDKLCFMWSAAFGPPMIVDYANPAACEATCMARFSNMVYTPSGGDTQVIVPAAVRRIVHVFMHLFDDNQ